MSRIDDLIAEFCPDGVGLKMIGSVCEVFNGYAFKSELFNTDGDGIPLIRIRDVNTGFSETFYSGVFDDRYVVEDGDLLIGMDGDFRATKWKHGKALLNQRVCRLQDFKPDMLAGFMYYIVQGELNRIQNSTQGSTVKHLSSRELECSRVPVPPIEVQREVVKILDAFTELEAELEAELEVRQKQYRYYRDELLSFERREDIRWATLGEIGAVSMCKRVFKSETVDVGDIPFYKIGTFGKSPDAFISRGLYEDYRSRYPFPKLGDILISAAGTIGRAIPYDGEDGYFQDSNIVWIDNDESQVTNRYLWHWYQIVQWTTDGGTIQRLYNENLRKTKIAIPPLDEQASIVAVLDKLNTLVSDISVGLPAEIAARRQQYAYYRNRLLSFKEAA